MAPTPTEKRAPTTPDGPAPPGERAALERLRDLVATPPARAWSDADLVELPRLYRLACSTLARLEATDARPRTVAEVRRLVERAQAELFRHRDEASAAAPRGLRRFASAVHTALWVRGPRAVRAEWRLLLATLVAVYGLAALAFVVVARDLELAYSLLDARVVETQIEQLEATAEGAPFRGNFTFGLGESPGTAAWIMVHNMGVGLVFFASALVPPLYLLLLSKNALMLGTYTAVAGHWGQAGSISSILWCHGVLEIQAIVLAGTAGLVLVRAVLFPGARSRPAALAASARRATDLFLPTFALLFCAGLIEGFVSPHAPTVVRLGVAFATGVLLVTWALAGGREPARAP